DVAADPALVEDRLIPALDGPPDGLPFQDVGAVPPRLLPLLSEGRVGLPEPVSRRGRDPEPLAGGRDGDRVGEHREEPRPPVPGVLLPPLPAPPPPSLRSAHAPHTLRHAAPLPSSISTRGPSAFQPLARVGAFSWFSPARDRKPSVTHPFGA